MDAMPRKQHRTGWSPGARGLGIVSASALVGVGVLYVGVLVGWFLVEATPIEPIGDPYLAWMEGLTIASALALLGFVIAVRCFADASRRPFALATLLFGGLGAGLTLTVHFVQLTAVRQLWRAGQVPDYRLVWPSPLFAVEYLAWDVMVGLTMIGAGLSLAGDPSGRPVRRALLIGGSLCLAGTAGPLSGWMLWQNVSLAGYAVVLPVAAALAARLFQATEPSAPAGHGDSEIGRR